MKYIDLKPGQFFRFAHGAPFSARADEESRKSLCLATDTAYVSDVGTGGFAQWDFDYTFRDLEVVLEPYAVVRQVVA